MIENFVRGPLFARFSSDSDAASPRQTQTDNNASGSPQRVAGRPPQSSVWGTVLHLTGQKGSGRPLRYRIQAMEENYKKYTANGLVRRGCPKGQPAAIFDHSLFKHNGRLLGATNHGLFHEPRVARGDVVSLNLLPRSGI